MSRNAWGIFAGVAFTVAFVAGVSTAYVAGVNNGYDFGREKQATHDDDCFNAGTPWYQTEECIGAKTVSNGLTVRP